MWVVKSLYLSDLGKFIIRKSETAEPFRVNGDVVKFNFYQEAQEKADELNGLWKAERCATSFHCFVVNGKGDYLRKGKATVPFSTMKEAQEKADELNGVNEMVKPEVKVTYEKVECDIWNIATLKEDFEAGNLFYDCVGIYKTVKNKLLIQEHLNEGDLYRRIETPVTLESELKEAFGDLINIYTSDFPKNERLLIGDEVVVDFSLIHQLSAILKKYGK